ncbi:MAG: M48 family metallopeptidase [bacterium]
MNIYLAAVLTILIGGYLLDLVADLLNLRHLSSELPDEFKDVYDPEKYKKSQDYLKANTTLSLLNGGLTTALTIVFILVGGFNFIDCLARGFDLGRIPTGLIFAGGVMLLLQLCHIPFDAYRTFVIEEKFGFNKTTPRIFITDVLKKWLLSALFGGVLFAAVVWIFSAVGALAWLYCWAVVSSFQIFIIFIAPAVILPMFNKFTPLEEGGLKTAIEDYAGSQGFKMRGVFTMDASRRSGKSNAFFAGFGRFRRIVLFDTLIRKHTVDELISVLAHEMGHYKRGHILRSTLLMILTTGLMFFVLSLFINNGGLFEAFGMSHVSVYASIFFFGFLFIPIQTVISIFGNVLSRRHEYQADAYAALTYGRPEAMISALKKLSADNLSNLTPHPVKVFLDYSHPPMLQRISALRKRCPVHAG